MSQGPYAELANPLRKSAFRHSEWFEVSSNRFESPLLHNTLERIVLIKSTVPQEEVAEGEPRRQEEERDPESAANVASSKSSVSSLFAYVVGAI